MVEVLCFFVLEDIPAKLTASETPPAEVLYVEVKLGKEKWLIGFSCNPNSQHIEALGTRMDFYSSTYENFIFLGDLKCRHGTFGFEGFLQFLCSC